MSPVARELKSLAHQYERVVATGRYELLDVDALRRAFAKVRLGGHGFPAGQFLGAAARRISLFLD